MLRMTEEDLPFRSLAWLDSSVQFDYAQSTIHSSCAEFTIPVPFRPATDSNVDLGAIDGPLATQYI